MSSRSEAHNQYADDKCVELVDQASTLRQENWFSQRDVGEILDMKSHSSIAIIEQHKAIPRLDKFLRMLSVYGYTLKIVPK